MSNMLCLTDYGITCFDGEPVQYTKVVKSTNADGLGHLDCYRENGGIDTYDGISDFSGYSLTNEDGTPAEYTEPEQNALDRLAAENKLLKAQVQAQTERSDFLEDCLAEMAAQVYNT